MSLTAIYSVTRGIRMLLRSQIARVSSTAVVTLLPPGELPEVSGVNVYLYRVVENPTFKNDPWRGDRATPPLQQPVLSLQLSYLLTPLGARPVDGSFDQGDDAHTMLGAAMSALFDNPILNHVHLPDAGGIGGFDADLVFPPEILNSYEQIKVTLLPTTIDELSKIWATINQPYRLSVAYEVSLVQITPPRPAPVSGAIVTSTGLDVTTLDPPRLAAINPAQGALASAPAAGIVPNLIEIQGFGFAFPGQSPIVRIGGEVATVQTVPVPTDQRLTVALPVGLAAGPQADVRMTLNGRTSLPLTFTITPWITRVQPIRSALEGVGPNLTVEGAGFTATPQAVRFDGPGGPVSVGAFDAGGTDSRAVIDIPATLANGVYDVRLIAGPAGANVSNPRTLEIIPRLDVAVTVGSATAPDGRPVSRLTLNGARLNGTDIRVSIDGVPYVAPANANAAQIVYQMGRVLSAGPHPIAVQVDGHQSHTVTVTV